MSRYPFDVQTCHGTIEPQSNLGFFAKLVPDHLAYHGTRDLMKYVVDNISFVNPYRTYVSDNEVKSLSNKTTLSVAVSAL